MTAPAQPGPGKYDDACGVARVMCGATVCLLVVLDGVKGSGFSVQALYPIPPRVLADVLQDVANQLKAMPDVPPP